MALDAARALFPWWVAPAAFAVRTSAGLLVGAGLGLLLFMGARARMRRGGARPWPQVAREVYPYRVAVIVATLVLPAVAFLFGPFGWRSLLGMDGPIAACVVAGAVAGISWWRFRITRLVYGHGLSPGRSLRGVATRVLLLFPHLWFALGFAFAMPPRLDAATALLLGAGTLVLVFIARGATFRLAQAAGLVRDAPDGIAAAVREASARARVPLAGVHVIELSQVNAFALPFAGRMLFTRLALERLEQPAVLAIAAHEIGHLGEPARARWSRAAGVLVLVPLMAIAPLGATYGLAGPLAAVVAALLIGQVVHRSTRALEHRADAAARENEGDAGAYARALEEIHRLNLTPVVLRTPSHPSLYDRLTAAGAPPAYARPRPPSRALSLMLLVLVALAGVVLGAGLDMGAARAAGAGRPWVAIVLDGGGQAVAGKLASDAQARGRPGEAAAYWGAAADLDPYHAGWPAHQAIALSAAGRRAEAREALAEAERRAADAGREAEWEAFLDAARAAIEAPPTGPPRAAPR